MDRLDSSLTCRRWAEAMRNSQLLHDVWLDIAGFEMEAARSVLVNSRRQYTKLVLFRADLSEFDSEFWANIGTDLRVLEVVECSWSTDSFYAILQQCTKLESLKMARNRGRTTIDDFVPPRGICLEQLRESLSQLRHLHLDIELTGDILDLLLGLMPNVTSINLSYSSHTDPDILERLPSLLKKNRITRTEADFQSIYFTNEDVVKFVDGTSSTLEKLKIDADRLTGAALDAIASCTRLRALKLLGFRSSSNSSDIEKLVSNLPPDLENLELLTSHMLEFQNMPRLLELRKLRSLRLMCPSRNRFTHESLRRLEGMSTLVNLNLYGFDVDCVVIQRLGCLKNLRSLTLRECPDSECFKAIYENFRRLTELRLGEVDNLTDVDGSKLCGFKDLRILSFERGVKFTDVTFKRGVGSRTLKSLHIDGCSITDDGLMSLASHHDRLERLTLYNSPNITSEGLLALLRNEPRLKMFFTGISLPPLMSLKDICPRLRF